MLGVTKTFYSKSIRAMHVQEQAVIDLFFSLVVVRSSAEFVFGTQISFVAECFEAWKWKQSCW